ncbi:4-alpha-glucanotransferase [Geobacter sp. FeAm09]|uniref:4-alpha-glucanotransferase n=1 Tax=Geobacter sp. FeAm09 TaxID=2597769 RepID=UPI002101F2D9|nr:4-alpha-glucanotransferase [Geobacter sp. FeAm09]
MATKRFRRQTMLKRRSCGVLLHPTSLPGHDGIGTLGDDARRFVDLLSTMGMSYWQVLPLTPPACGNSPYSSLSAFAGNPLLIDLRQLAREGDLPLEAVGSHFPEERVDYGGVSDVKPGLLHQAAATFLAAERSSRTEEFWHFCDTTPWLHDFALFMALKQHYKGKSWQKWPKEAALLTAETFEKASLKLGPEIGAQKYLQWQFSRQWQALRAYAASRGVSFIGDIPIFVAYDSADVWRNRHLFLLDGQGRPTSVAGVPPDYFSRTGQLWGNPLYDWEILEHRGFDWWIERFRHAFSLFDTVRIDHFRGFEAAWQVPAHERTAERGAWGAGPGERLFEAVRSALGALPIIAEDLGIITPAVEALRDRFGFPGMKILQFAFDSGPANPYLPHNCVKNCVVYTGTHDNDTTLGWYTGQDEHHRSLVRDYVGSNGRDIVADIVRIALMSVADTVVIPFQDILGLPGTARMNLPGTAFGNWEWRFSWDMVHRGLADEMNGRLERYGRRRGNMT